MTKGQKLNAPKGCPQVMANLINDCCSYARQSRPLFAAIQSALEGIIRQPYLLENNQNSDIR